MSESHIVPASDGQEHPFTVRGVRWLYCWDRKRKAHCYRNLDTGELVYNREFHPAFSPQFTDIRNPEWDKALAFF